MKTLKLLLVSLLVMALAFPTAAMAKDTAKAGKITSVTGKAEVKKSGGSKRFNAFKGVAITQGDTVITGKNGKIVMDLSSDKEVTIGSDTTLVISELVQSAKAMNGKTSLSLLKGKVLVKIKKKLEGDSRFEIETPTAIMGVMGTEFTVRYENDESYVGVFEGRVSTSYGERTDEVDPNEQLLIGENETGRVEELSYLDLPLVGLEHYLKRLERDPDADPALLRQVTESIREKKEDEAAAAAAGDSGNKPSGSTVVYEDTPTPAPSSAPSPSPAPPASGPPELDAEAFYEDLYTYMMNDKTFVLPFTTDIAAAGPNASFSPAMVLVEVASGDGASERSYESQAVAVVRYDQNDKSRLVIELEEGVPYGSLVRITVQGGSLKNRDTGDIQQADQVTVSPQEQEGFVFKLELEAIETKLEYGEAEENRELVIPTLGFNVMSEREGVQFPNVSVERVCYSFPGAVYGVGHYDGKHCYADYEGIPVSAMLTLDQGSNTARLTLHSSYFSHMEVSTSYELRIELKDDEGHVVDHLDLLVHAVGLEPPILMYGSVYMADLQTVVLPFSTDLEPVTGATDPSATVTVEYFSYDQQNPQNDRFKQIEDIEAYIDESNPSRLIVALPQAVEYGTQMKVTVKARSWKNPLTGDVQAEERTEYFYAQASVIPSAAFFAQGSDSDDLVLDIHSMGGTIGQAELKGFYCFAFDRQEGEGGDCSGFEPSDNVSDMLEMTDGGVRLKGSYFSNAQVPAGSFHFEIAVTRGQGEPEYLSFTVLVIDDEWSYPTAV